MNNFFKISCLVVGVLIGIASILGLFFGSYVFLAIGIWNLIQAWESITFFSFLGAILLIGLRGILTLIGVAIGLGVAGVLIALAED